MLDKLDIEGADLGKMLREAPMATLLMLPTTREARMLEARLLEITLEWEKATAPRKRRRRNSATDNLKMTISAFTADLVLHSKHEPSSGFCFRSLDRDFSETVAEDRQFTAVREAWEALGYFKTEAGFLPSDDFEGTLVRSRRGWATRFRPTTALISLAAEFGITPDNIGDHYQAETGRTFPIELRAKKLSSGQGPGRRMKLRKSQPEVQRLAAEVREINQFLAAFTYSLGESPRFRRIFNNGDQPSFCPATFGSGPLATRGTGPPSG